MTRAGTLFGGGHRREACAERSRSVSDKGRRQQCSRALGNPELRLELARLRVELRRLDREMAGLRREKRAFYRVGFGRDMQDIQLIVMEGQREDLAQKVLEIERRLGMEPAKRTGVWGWLFLPVMLVLRLLQPLFPRRNPREAVGGGAMLARTGSSYLPS